MPISKASETPYRNSDFLPTGLPSLDRIIGGGIPTRRITEISGLAGLGKTTIALSICREAIEAGKDVLFVDMENSLESGLSQIMGVDEKKLDYLLPEDAETALDEVEEYVRKHPECVVIIDAVGALLPRAEKEKAAGEKTIGGQAGLMARFCRKIVPLLSLRNSALIVLNHEFTDIMSGKVKTSGGAKLEYAKALWIRLKQKYGVAVKDGDKLVGKVIVAEVKKNKVASTEGQSCDLQLIFGRGFNTRADLMEQAKEKLFTKEGQFYYWNGERVARGDKGLREAFQDTAFAEKIHDALQRT